MKNYSLCIALISFFSLLSAPLLGAKIKVRPVKTEIRLVDGKYRFYRDGEPYFVKGAGLQYGDIANLASHGANSLRNWTTNPEVRDVGEMLDEAYKHGLTMTVGLDLIPERKGFDYNNKELVRMQFERMKEEVVKYKDHPALLAWGIGNELNHNYTNPKVWDAVNEISEMIHEIDGEHPTTTMLSAMQKHVVDEVKKRAPDLDFLSIQVYGNIVEVPTFLRDCEWEGPYLISEWGATGHWEVEKTEWGVAIEQTSAEKAESIIRRYRDVIQADTRQLLGSYVFLWEQKQEQTPTWYGFFLETGEEMEPVDAMQYLWTGRYPENRAPRLNEIVMNGKTRFDSVVVKPGEEVVVDIFVTDFEGDRLTYRTEILEVRPEYYLTGGDHEKRPETLEVGKYEGPEDKIKFIAPEKGDYRFFVYVFDGNGKTANANFPFRVE